jgi:class 3 adenylate cyclase
VIRERSGTIIKTIGDAVMAGFERPQDAVRASIEITSLWEFRLGLGAGPLAEQHTVADLEINRDQLHRRHAI